VYEECFQCLDCIAIHDSPQRCPPLIARGRQRVFVLRPVPALAGEASGAGP
jgi:NosR/NirI family transcriptional regulator, nitrous oxide reductase regulator